MKRHAPSTRIWHWINAVAFAVLFMSGLNISNAHRYLYWGDYGYDPANIVDIPTSVVHLYPRGEDLTALLQTEGSNDIYLITNGQRQLMPPKGDDLWALGFALEDISQVPVDFLERFRMTVVPYISMEA